jgi:protein NrfD
MSLSAVLFLFLAHLGVGIALTLLFVPRDAGIKFFRFNSGLAAILLVIALAFGSGAPAGTPGTPADRIGLLALQLATLTIVIYWATIGRVFTKFRTAILGASAAAGVVALVGQAMAASVDQPAILQGLAVASFVTSALLLGGACTAMVLGHWYLILPSMEVSYLQSIVALHIASLVGRVAVVAAALWFALSTSFAANPIVGPTFHRYILSVDGIFFWQRILFGLAGPAVLSYLTWQTAKIRSTQSATGILYVDFFTVVVGEVLAKYIVLATHVPV